MSGSYTLSESDTFTLTHAKYLSSKVRTDLMRIHRLYDGEPTVREINEYEEELTALFHKGYLKRVQYGFKRNGQFVSPTLSYEASELSSGGVDDRPGKIPVGANIIGANFTSFLSYSDKWFALSSSEQASFKSGLPFQRVSGSEPTVAGYYQTDKTYSAGGHSMNRSVVRSL